MAGHALHIGLNAVNPDHYNGWDGRLNACENDMNDMSRLAQQAGFEGRIELSTAEATRDSVLGVLADFATKAVATDLVLVTYSGHGGRMPDLGGDEWRDALDETWCLFDGELLDDELLLAFTAFREQVRVVVVSDSCHSGGMERFNTLDGRAPQGVGMSMPRSMPIPVGRRTFEANREFYTRIQNETDAKLGGGDEQGRENKVRCSVRLLAACMESQLSYESSENGYFTDAILEAWDFGRFVGDYQAFYRRVSDLTPGVQTPQHKLVGLRSPAFDRQRPFHI